MNLNEIILRKTVPIVINSFNQPTYLKNIINKLLINNFKNIIVLDNNSTNSDLISYYEDLKNEGKFVTVLYYNDNKGPRYFHMNNMHSIFGNIPHIYTDPDIDFDFIADDLVSSLLEISEKYHFFKVGSAIEIPKINETKANLFLKAQHLDNKVFSIQEWENQFWLNPIEEYIYDAPIDTTFHLFNPIYFTDPKHFISGIRVSKPGFKIKHLPWYLEDIIPESELEFYRNSSMYSSYILKDNC